MRKTPILTDHARQRSAEMGLSTKVAKAIVRNAEVCYPSTPTKDGVPTVIYLWTGQPAYAVCCIEGEPDLVLSVLFHTPEFYARAGSSFVSVNPALHVASDL